jgi:hypothetical protein
MNKDERALAHKLLKELDRLNTNIETKTPMLVSAIDRLCQKIERHINLGR